MLSFFFPLVLIVTLPNSQAQIMTCAQYKESTNYVRLPTSVVPEHYLVDINVQNGSYFIGSLVLKAVVREETNSVTVHAWYLEIRDVRAYDEQGMELAVKSSKNRPCLRQFEVVLKKPLKVGSKFALWFYYIGIYANLGMVQYRNTGITQIPYRHKGKDGDFIATNFKRFGARRLGPFMDQPNLKATFQLAIAHRSDTEARTNTPLLLRQGSRSVFKPTPRMSTYQLGIYVGEPSVLSMETGRGTKFSMFVWPGLGDFNMTYGFGAATAMQNWFGDHFGLPYMLPKQDIVSVTKSGWSVESWGLIITDYQSTLYDGDLRSTSEQIKGLERLARAIVQQWFGNLVTVKWWDEQFLMEGFATFAIHPHTQTLFPEQQKIIEHNRMVEFRRAMKDDQLATSHPLLSVLDDKPIMQFKNFLNAYAYANADRMDLWRIFTTEAKNASEVKDWCAHYLDVKQLMEPWILQQNFPVVTVRKPSAAQSSIILGQESIVSGSKLPKSAFSYKWPIPIWYRSDRHPEEDKQPKMVWLGSGKNNPCNAKETTTIEADWIAVNVNNRAFIRVKYDDATFDALFNQIKANTSMFDQEYLAQLLHDEYYFSYIKKQQNRTRAYNLMNLLMGIRSASLAEAIDEMAPKIIKWASYTGTVLEEAIKKANKHVPYLGMKLDDNADIRLYQLIILQWATEYFRAGVQVNQTFGDCMNEYTTNGLQNLTLCSSVEPNLWRIVFVNGAEHATKEQLSVLRKAEKEVKAALQKGDAGYMLKELSDTLNDALNCRKTRKGGPVCLKILHPMWFLH